MKSDTENTPKLGHLFVADGDADRDAIHVAVIPAIAQVFMKPGQHVAIKDGYAVPVPPGEGVGVVDPFLTEYVEERERFWLCLYPGTITSLRHDWTHPAFPKVAPVSPAQGASEAWLQAFAQGVGLSYEDLLQGAREWVNCGEYLNRGSLLEGEYVPEEFWHHFEVVTGTRVDEGSKESFFTCSC